MKKALSLLLALALLLLSLPLLTGCGTFLTVDFSELGTELDLDAYLATVGLTYQDCYDYPDYLAYYTEEAFLQKLISLSTVNWSAYEKIGEINAAVADREAEAKYYYSAYGGYSGTGCTSVDQFASLLYGYDLTKYPTVRAWMEATRKEAVLKEELTLIYLTQKNLLPTEADVDQAYADLISELLDRYTSMTQAVLESQFAAQYGANYLRDRARANANAQRLERHFEEDWTVKHAEAVPVELDKSPIDPSKYEETPGITTLVKITMGGAVSGDVYVRLYPDQAPTTVANFQYLVMSGFYNGLTFHRSVKDFCLQGGDPKGNGTGGSANQIKGEFLENGWGNHLHHVTGVVSMARSSDFDSASSQFFFTLSDSAAPSLDGKYAAFGYVVAGWETVEAAAKIPTSNEKPTTDILIEKITFVTPVTE